MSERMGTEHYGEERAKTAEALAELIIAEELKRARWQEADLKIRPKGGFSEGVFGGALASEDNGEGGVDRRTSDDGHAQLSEPSLVPPEKAGREVIKIKNRPFYVSPSRRTGKRAQSLHQKSLATAKPAPVLPSVPGKRVALKPPCNR